MKHTIISLIVSSSVLGLASCTTTESSMGYMSVLTQFDAQFYTIIDGCNAA